jgi:hypothetical protein
LKFAAQQAIGLITVPHTEPAPWNTRSPSQLFATASTHPSRKQHAPTDVQVADEHVTLEVLSPVQVPTGTTAHAAVEVQHACTRVH